MGRKMGPLFLKVAMKWLFEDLEIANLIEHEIQIYLHHGSVFGGQPAYFTEVQHVCRQDPVY